jgi:single-stranded-DNA-specific exonuclease
VAATLKPGLIITVDNGIASLAGVAEARRHGIDVLVTDHHLPGETLPDAILVNPNLPGSRFASPALAGVGVAFYVMAALARRLGGRSAAIAGLLDLVALGTVADVVPLDHNNRILVHQGLQRIRAGRCVPGIAALAAVAGRSLTRVSATDLGFFLGPRLNAAGRLEDMSVGIRCLLTDDPAEAAALAAELDRLNRERRAIETRMQEEALAAVRRLRLEQPGAQLPPALALFDADWHQGVVGLVASRVRERVHRPVIAFALADDGQLRGSARSVPGVHVRDVLAAIDARHPTLIERYGGHAMAAGLTLAPDHLERFTRAFADEVGRSLDPALLQGTLVTDGELAAAEFSLETAEQLRAGGPWGQAFPEPLFDGEYPVLEARVLGERHLKLWVRPDLQSPPQEAIAFGWLDGEPRPVPRAAERVHLVFRLDVNDYLGMRRPQLVVDYLERR